MNLSNWYFIQAVTLEDFRSAESAAGQWLFAEQAPLAPEELASLTDSQARRAAYLLDLVTRLGWKKRKPALRALKQLEHRLRPDKTRLDLADQWGVDIAFSPGRLKQRWDENRSQA